MSQLIVIIIQGLYLDRGFGIYCFDSKAADCKAVFSGWLAWARQSEQGGEGHWHLGTPVAVLQGEARHGQDPERLKKELEEELLLSSEDLRSHAWYHGRIPRQVPACNARSCAQGC